jgi:acetyltransferase-like isoleucine patch superfamily enzyme
MGNVYHHKLDAVEKIILAGLDADSLMEVLTFIEAPPVSKEVLENLKVYSETLPKEHEVPFTSQQRYLHFLWDMFDKLALSLIVPFSIPFRRLLGKHLFKRCGAALIVEEHVRFNFGQFLEMGDNVFFNRGVFLDSKGGIELGNFVALAEDVRIFTHSHSESSHMEREYHKVVVEDYAKIYAGATILPGVTVGKEAIVASGSMVTHDVPPNMVVAGSPAKVIRERKSEGKHGDELDHLWLY